MAKSSVSRTSSSANKSWVELCDEDNEYLTNSSGEENLQEKESCNVEKEPAAEVQTCATVTVKSNSKEKCQDENMPVKNFSEAFQREIKSESEIKTEKVESPSSFSYATILKNSASKGNISASPCTPQKPTEKEGTSDAKHVKREIQREFLQDDLSLTSHLDVFHMQSPMKLEPVDEEMASPLKSDRATRSATKRFCPAKLSMSEDAMMPDEVLMPSPQKVTRLSSRRKREPGESPMNHKRSKRSSESRKTPKCVVQVNTPPVELETDEQILLRRQKQIDYGKNTVGYERYCQMVPKAMRKRKHPQTPSKHIKYSRRCWDGLVKVWRQKLHFWDPPSEGGGNIEDLDISSMSEASSDTSSIRGSLPATPRETRRSSRTRRAPSSTSESSSADIDCSPLKGD